MNRKSQGLSLTLILVGMVIAAVCLIIKLENDESDSTALTTVEKPNGNVHSEEETSIGESSVESETEAKADEQFEQEAPMSEEERLEAEDEAKVDEFDNLTDKWMDPVKAGVSTKDVEHFVAMFKRVPDARKDECIHRALNLIPDDNVLLLAGVLMDERMDQEIVETVFNDVLNRDETVKMPIMKMIYSRKSHPCWSDVAWIFDVTGESSAQ